MNAYVPTAPRAAFAFAALVMTTLTLALAVLLPGHVSPGAHEIGTLAASGPDEHGRIEVDITPARIDVVAEREPQTVFGAIRHTLPAKREAS
jgi:hypothetical protein